VLLYHALARADEGEGRGREKKYWVSLRQFQGQLEQIRRAGRQVALLGELWAQPGAPDEDKPPIVLTFDDGHRSNYDVAFPALLEAGVRADFFVNTSTVGQPSYLEWRQILEMQRTGMAFHSHSHDHVALSRLSIQELEVQLGESKRRLEDRLGCSVDYLSVPYGFVNRQVFVVARRLGYRGVCTSRGWPAHPSAFQINRVAVYRHTGLREFRSLVVGDPFCYAFRSARAALLYVPKQVLLRLDPARLGVRVREEQG